VEITKDRMEEAILFLAHSDVDYARARTLYEGLSEQRKTVKAANFLRSGAGSAAAREQDSYNSFEYKAHLEKMEVAQLEYLTLQAKRTTEAIIIDCWRSLNAARNKGQLS
jgi:hypothetical protein